MTDAEIDELIEDYLDEYGGSRQIYRRRIAKGVGRGHAFFIACTLEDADLIREAQGKVWLATSRVTNVDIMNIIEYLMDQH